MQTMLPQGESRQYLERIGGHTLSSEGSWLDTLQFGHDRQQRVVSEKHGKNKSRDLRTDHLEQAATVDVSLLIVTVVLLVLAFHT